MNQKIILGIALFVCATPVVWAESSLMTFEAPPTIVSSTKFPISSDRAIDDVRVLTRGQLADDGIVNLDQLFNEVPNIHTINSGGQRSLFFRGGASNLTNLMVDDVSLRDVSAPAATPMLNNIPISSIERVEIISGNKSSLYGSSASNGVVSIYTDLQNRGNFTNVNATVGDRRFSGGFTRGLQLGDSQVNLTFSHAQDKSRSDIAAGTELDQKWADQLGASFRQTVGSANVYAQLQLFKGQDDLDNFNYDTFPFTTIDDPDRRIVYNENRVKIEAEYPFSTTLTSKLSYLRFYTTRDDFNDPDSVSSSNEHNLSVGGTDEVEGSIHWTGIANSDLLAGLVWDRESTVLAAYDYPRDHREPLSLKEVNQNRSAAYLAWDQQVGIFQYFLNDRQDISEAFNANTISIGSKAYVPYGITLSGKYSTGFTAPSLYQRFDPSYGNTSLTAETSRTWDFGLSKRWWMVTFSANYFDTEIDNLIQSDIATFKYSNATGKNRYSGLELQAEVERFSWLRHSQIAYTVIDSKSDSSKSRSIPDYKWNVSTGIGGLKWATRVNLIGVGPRLDATSGLLLTLPPYAIANLSGTYWLSESESMILSVENVTNTKYEWVTNYQGPGRNFTASYQLEL